MKKDSRNMLYLYPFSYALHQRLKFAATRRSIIFRPSLLMISFPSLARLPVSPPPASSWPSDRSRQLDETSGSLRLRSANREELEASDLPKNLGLFGIAFGPISFVAGPVARGPPPGRLKRSSLTTDGSEFSDDRYVGPRLCLHCKSEHAFKY